MSDNIIETFNLTKEYHLKKKKKKILALDNFNISIKEGEIFGLLGPNGAGKTTLIQILSTIQQPTSGYAIIDGYNIIEKPKQAKLKIALMLRHRMLYYRITAYQNLKFFCKIYKVHDYKTKIQKIMQEFELEKWLHQYVSSFSTGMMMKLALCRTFLIDRKIMFLDEPTVGLDVKSVAFIVEKIKNTNKTIFLTSHDMNVVEKLCDRIAFINNGRILKIGTQQELKDWMQKSITIEIYLANEKTQLMKELKSCNFIVDCKEMNSNIVINLDDRKNYRELLSILGNYEVIQIKEQKISLEDLFIKFA